MNAYDDMSGLRLPPHSIESEQSVLGGLLLDNGAWERLDGQLTEGDFYHADHRRIFSCIAAMLDRGQPADVVTVYEALRAAGEAEQVGGLAYLNAMAQNTPSAANIRRYAEIVRGCRVRRDVMALGQDIAALAAEPSRANDTAGLVEQVTGMVMALADTRHAGREPQTIGELLPGVLDAIDQRMNDGGAVSGLATGFRLLDELTCGLQAGDLIIVAGRPGMGKTTLAVNIAENVALAGGAAFVVSLEMSAAQLAERSVARFGAIDTQALRSGRISQDGFTRLSAALDRLRNQRLVEGGATGIGARDRRQAAPGPRAVQPLPERGRAAPGLLELVQALQGRGSDGHQQRAPVAHPARGQGVRGQHRLPVRRHR